MTDTTTTTIYTLSLHDALPIFQLPFDDFRLGMPVALSKGMYNYNLLSRLLGHMRHVEDFNQLPIPFLCIGTDAVTRSEEHTSELQSRPHLVCRLLLEKKNR